MKKFFLAGFFVFSSCLVSDYQQINASLIEKARTQSEERLTNLLKDVTKKENISTGIVYSGPTSHEKNFYETLSIIQVLDALDACTKPLNQEFTSVPQLLNQIKKQKAFNEYVLLYFKKEDLECTISMIHSMKKNKALRMAIATGEASISDMNKELRGLKQEIVNSFF